MKVVLILAERLKGLRFAIRGTAGLVLQGLEMNVDDIDVLTDEETALACNDLLAEYLIEEVAFKESEKFKSYFGKFEIESVPVEIMGEWQIKDNKGIWSQPFNASERIKLDKGDKDDIYVTAIEDELKMFALMGRWTAYQKIKKQIAIQENDKDQLSMF